LIRRHISAGFPTLAHPLPKTGYHQLKSWPCAIRERSFNLPLDLIVVRKKIVLNLEVGAPAVVGSHRDQRRQGF